MSGTSFFKSPSPKDSVNLGFVDGKGKGTYIFDFNDSTGEFQFVDLLESGENSTYLALNAKKT